MHKAFRRWATMFALAALLAPAIDAGPGKAQTLNEIEAAIVAGDVRAVSDLAAAEGRPDAERAYLEGRALLRAKRYEEAAAKLREALRLAPGSRRARWYLVQALVAAEDYDAAAFHLDELFATAGSDEEAARLAGMRRAVLSRRPMGFSFGFTIQPSTNINRATLNETLPSLGGLSGQVDTTGESGVSATTSVGAYRRFELEELGTLTATIGASATRYTDSSYDRNLFSGALTLRRSAPDGSVDFTLEGFRGLYTDEDQDFVLLRLGAGRQILKDGARYSVKARVSRQMYDDAGVASRSDNMRGDLALSAAYPLGERLTGTAGVEVASTSAEDPRFSYLGVKTTLGIKRSWESGWIAGLSGSFEFRDYQRRFGGVFPFRREDRVLSVGATLGNTRVVVQGFTPVLSCTAQRTESTVTFYDNVSVEECALSLTREF